MAKIPTLIITSSRPMMTEYVKDLELVETFMTFDTLLFILMINSINKYC